MPRPGLAALALLAALAGCGADAEERRAATTATAPPHTAFATTAAAPRGATPATAARPAAAAQPIALPGPAAQAAAVRRFAKLGKPIYCGAGKRRLVALTFDDGPGRYTPIVLRQLREAGGRATFFLVGKSIDRFPDTARTERELAAIGEHSMTHANLPTLSRAAARQEIAQGKSKAIKAAGEPVALFRPPYGNRNPAIDREVRRQEMAQILWDVDSTDSRIAPPADFHEISARVRIHARPGSIVLMHENRGQTIRAMRSILPALKRRHLKLVTVPELLAADPPTRAQLAKGVKGCKASAAARKR